MEFCDKRIQDNKVIVGRPLYCLYLICKGAPFVVREVYVRGGDAVGREELEADYHEITQEGQERALVYPDLTLENSHQHQNAHTDQPRPAKGREQTSNHVPAV